MAESTVQVSKEIVSSTGDMMHRVVYTVTDAVRKHTKAVSGKSLNAAYKKCSSTPSSDPRDHPFRS